MAIEAELPEIEVGIIVGNDEHNRWVLRELCARTAAPRKACHDIAQELYLATNRLERAIKHHDRTRRKHEPLLEALSNREDGASDQAHHAVMQAKRARRTNRRKAEILQKEVLFFENRVDEISNRRRRVQKMLATAAQDLRHAQNVMLGLQKKKAAILHDVDTTQAAFDAALVEAGMSLADYDAMMARWTGVPEKYWAACVVDTKSSSEVHCYFGGKDTPAGRDHGHYVLRADGLKDPWYRDPGPRAEQQRLAMKRIGR